MLLFFFPTSVVSPHPLPPLAFPPQVCCSRRVPAGLSSRTVWQLLQFANVTHPSDPPPSLPTSTATTTTALQPPPTTRHPPLSRRRRARCPPQPSWPWYLCLDLSGRRHLPACRQTLDGVCDRYDGTNGIFKVVWGRSARRHSNCDSFWIIDLK